MLNSPQFRLTSPTYRSAPGPSLCFSDRPRNYNQEVDARTETVPENSTDMVGVNKTGRENEDAEEDATEQMMPKNLSLKITSVVASKPKRQVYLCVIFLKIGEIDTIKEQYAADVLIKAKWRDADMDAAGSVEYDWLHNWTPKLYIENTIGETREQIHQMIALNEFGHAFLVEKRRVSGVFLENLELNHFPFDVQDLTITVASNLPSSEIRLLNDPDEPHRINKQSFVDEQEWYLYKHIDSEQHELANEYIENASVRPALSVKCRAARRPAYFIWNIFLVTFLICSLSLVTFAVDRSQPQSRLQLTFTLVLTLVAFKFVVNQCLPKISYLTYLDKYIISSLFFLTIICIWHGGIAVIEKAAERFGILLWADTELYVILLIGIGYFTFNVGFILMIYCVACKRRRDMKSKDSEYLEKVKCQMNKKGSRAHRTTSGDVRLTGRRQTDVLDFS
ncbi:hypothetical protein SprV_0200651300 [Sparganum proliferum]